jgi:hypothetical protein
LAIACSMIRLVPNWLAVIGAMLPQLIWRVKQSVLRQLRQCGG